jgi:hypothetical protein
MSLRRFRLNPQSMSVQTKFGKNYEFEQYINDRKFIRKDLKRKVSEIEDEADA